MDRSQVGEVYYIAPIGNLGSIMTRGILSARAANGVRHTSIALEDVKQRRANRPVTASTKLPDYVNLYFCARNPMMSLILYRGDPLDSLCVLCVDDSVLDMPGVAVADGNASSDYTRLDPVDIGLPALNFEQIHAEWWTRHDNVIDRWNHKRVKCAEALVPEYVDPSLITRVLTPTEAVGVTVRPIIEPRPATPAPYVFFLGGTS